MVKLTRVQREALEKLADAECGWVHKSTAKVLVRLGFIERYGSTFLTEWWTITPAGRAALGADQ